MRKSILKQCTTKYMEMEFVGTVIGINKHNDIKRFSSCTTNKIITKTTSNRERPPQIIPDILYIEYIYMLIYVLLIWNILIRKLKLLTFQQYFECMCGCLHALDRTQAIAFGKPKHNFKRLYEFAFTSIDKVCSPLPVACFARCILMSWPAVLRQQRRTMHLDYLARVAYFTRSLPGNMCALCTQTCTCTYCTCTYRCAIRHEVILV